MAQFVRLKVMNWGVVASSVLAEARALSRRNVFPLELSLYELLIHGITANPRDSRLGRATLYHLALARVVRVCCADPTHPTAAEMREVLRLAPELRKFYAFEVRGETWHLRFRAPSARWKRADWTKNDWQLLFDIGGTPKAFSLAGSEFHAITTLFSYLNGDQRVDAILERFSVEDRKVVRRFLRRCEALDLLEYADVSFARRAKGRFVELIGHSCLRFQNGNTSILVDPLFLIPRPAGHERDNFRLLTETASQFPRLRAVLFTHSHWDHLHFSTIVRLPRDVPIYVPRVETTSPFNPSCVDFFASLGFTDVHEVCDWKPIDFDGIRFTPTPYVGEWLGPGSTFDGFTYLVETSGKTMYGAVDSNRDERGDMLPVMTKLKSTVGDLDYVFFNASNVEHDVPSFCGMPFNYSSEYEQRFSHMMRFLPDSATVNEWLKVLQPKTAVRYADFRFTKKKALSRRVTARVGVTAVQTLQPGERLPL